MSLTLNMVGGGGGGLKATDALLRVQAPAGSTVTVSKGTTTKTDLGHENADDHTVYDYYFIIHASQFDSVNPWTVTATLSGDSASDTIVIDTADEYDVVFYAILPSGYTSVEYIQSTGTQRITIPLATAKNIFALKMVADIAIMGQASSDGASIIGDVDIAPYMKFIDDRNSGIYPTCNTDGAVAGTPDPSLLNTRAELTFDGSDGTLKIYKADNLWYSGARSTKTVNSLSLLATYRGTGYSYICMAAKLYKFKVYDTDHITLLKDCYPCYRNSDSVVGLYDKVSETFLTNAGTGTFIVGSDL